MRILFKKDILVSAVTRAMSAVSTNNTIKAIEGIRITARKDGVCLFDSYDLEKGFHSEVLAESVEEEGAFIFNGQKMMQFVRVLPGETLTIEVEENGLAKISGGESVFTLNTLPGEMFPSTPELSGDWEFRVQGEELRDSIQKTMYAVAVNDPRPALNGILFRFDEGHMVLAATDSYRLAVCDKEFVNGNGERHSIVVPGKTVTELNRLLGDVREEVTIRSTRKHVLFTWKNTTFFSRLIDAEYMDYEKFMPKNIQTKVYVRTEELLRAVERASLVTESKVVGQEKSFVRLTVKENILDVYAVSMQETAHDEIELQDMEGQELKIGFGSKFLLDALRACDTEFIRIELVSALISAVIYPDDTFEDEATKEKRMKRFENRGVVSETNRHLVVPLHMRES